MGVVLMSSFYRTDKRMKVDIDRNHNEATISLVDKNGNGIIVLKGQIGGCGWMDEAGLKELTEVLLALQLDKSPASIDGTD